MLWAFLIYGLICFVVSYVLVEYGQRYFYDEVTPFAALKVAGGAAIMAGLLTWRRSSFETMFTNDLPYTALIAIVWAGVFVLIYRFQPLHGAVFALAAVLILPGLASIVVQSLSTPATDPRTISNAPSRPLRKGSGVTKEAAKPQGK